MLGSVRPFFVSYRETCPWNVRSVPVHCAVCNERTAEFLENGRAQLRTGFVSLRQLTMPQAASGTFLPQTPIGYMVAALARQLIDMRSRTHQAEMAFSSC